MVDELLYENAPLIEVIAEVRWQLVQLGSIPGTAVDAHFPATSEALTELLRERGFGNVERLLPAEVPLELVSGQPVLRFRPKEGGWPLYQLGPGVFTANIVPPYGGWSAFKPTLRQGIECLLAAFPLSSQLMKIQGLHLRYVDAFTAVHGRTDDLSFLSNQFGVAVQPKPELLSKLKVKSVRSMSIEFQFGLDDSSMTLRMRAVPGKKDNADATIVELVAYEDGPKVASATDDILGWLDAAHDKLSITFETLISDGLRASLGPTMKAN